MCPSWSLRNIPARGVPPSLSLNIPGIASAQSSGIRLACGASFSDSRPRAFAENDGADDGPTIRAVSPGVCIEQCGDT